MKKVLKLIVAIILAIVILGGVLFLIDCSAINSGKKPKFAVTVNQLDDGGTTEYIGLGYKIIDFNMLNGYDEMKIGSWFMNAEDFKEEYEKYDINNEIIIPNEDEILGDIIMENDESGDIIISGDNAYEENFSGDIASEDKDISNIESGDIINTENVTSGDNTDLNPEIVSGDVEERNEYVFDAIVIGVNNNNLIVQALENEAINASSDMFSFSLNDENNSKGIEFLIGQKVKIEYTGTIRESYPAQIDVISIEIIE